MVHIVLRQESGGGRARENTNTPVVPAIFLYTEFTCNRVNKSTSLSLDSEELHSSHIHRYIKCGEHITLYGLRPSSYW